MKQKKGFTLIELIIVVSIIAVLSSLAYISLSGETAQARDSKRQADLKTLENAIAMSNAQGRSISYLDPVTTGTGAGDTITTTAGDVRVLRNASMFQLGSGFINSTILASIERDPKGSPYMGAFINSNQFQLIATLENSTTNDQEVHLVGSFKENAIVDNILVSIDNNDKLIPVGSGGQFVRGDVIQIGSEKMQVEDVSVDSGGSDLEAIIVCRGYNDLTSTCDGTGATVHKNRDVVQVTNFAANASSLFCLGTLQALAASGVDASALVASEVPANLSVTLSNVTLEDMYTCSASGDVKDGEGVVVYDVSL